MIGGLNSIITYLDTNMVLIVLAAVAYSLWREVGAAAVGAAGQLFVNADSSNWHHLPSGAAQGCANVAVLIAILPVVLFAALPTASIEISQRRARTSDVFDLTIFSSLFFATGFANNSALALTGASIAAGAVSGPLLLSLMLGSAAIAISSLSKGVLRVLEQDADNFGKNYNEETTFRQAKDRDARSLCSPQGSDQPISATPPANPVKPHAKPALASPAKHGETRSRPPVASPTYLFNRNEFFIFRTEHLKDLENLLRREPPGVLAGLQLAICRRLGRVPVEGDERGFVQAYVAQFRKRIGASYPTYFVPDRLDVAAA